MPSSICSFGFGVSLKKQPNMHVFVSMDCTSHIWHHATSLVKCFPFSWAMSPAVRIEASITETIDYSWSSHGYSNAWSVSLTFCAGSLWADDCFSLAINSRAAGTQLLAVLMHQEIQKLTVQAEHSTFNEERHAPAPIYPVGIKEMEETHAPSYPEHLREQLAWGCWQHRGNRYRTF